MSRPKQFLKHQKQKKAQPDPHTADEFLATGVEQEEGGEKWRAGDAAKSSRFFIRAIETYNLGIQNFPQSFDLAYNRARLQYEVSQQPRLLEHIPAPLPEILNGALESHRYALNLKPDDADTLFNAAQVLTSLGEFLIDEASPPASQNARTDTIPFLQEAVETFEKCLAVQQTRLEVQAQLESDANILAGESNASPGQSSLASGDVPHSIGAAEEQHPQEEQWASILEPITPSTLLETCLAEAHALSILIPLLPADQYTYQSLSVNVTTLLEKAEALLNLSADPTSNTSLALARLNLLSPLASLAYRSSAISARVYLDTVTSLSPASFSVPLLAANGPANADFADALVTFNATVSSVHTGSSSISSFSNLRWSALSTALMALSTADANPTPDLNRAEINGQRADTELRRVRLSEPDQGAFSPAVQNRQQLLKNAETYYRGAARLAAAEGDADSEKGFWGRCAIAKRMLGGSLDGLLGKVMNLDSQAVGREEEDMRAEGLIP